MWGYQPWDNDRAADWFGKLVEDTGFATKVRETLELSNVEDVDEENIPLLRAAAFCVLQFGYVYVWPIGNLEHDLKLAIQALKLVLEDEDYCYSEEVSAKVEQELMDIEKRLQKMSST